MKQTNEHIQLFFNQRAVEFRHSVRTLDWGSVRTQKIRFHILSEIGDLTGCSILDVGCGFADLFDFLQERRIRIKKYTGIEISDKILKMTKDKRSELDIRNIDILQENIESYDYVLGSGIHYLKTHDNYIRLRKLMQRMYEICNKGVATNMIGSSILSKSFADHVFVHNPEKVSRMAKQISQYSVLRQDYLPQDFTVYLYKTDWAGRNNFGAD